MTPSGFGISALRGALSFLTVVPVGGELPPPRLGRAYFPLVGLGVGAACGLAFFAVSLRLPGAVAAVAALAPLVRRRVMTFAPALRRVLPGRSG
jgi:cobalamin synthase